MKNSKLINLIKTFTSHEFRELELFIESPYFNRGRDLSAFFNCLKKYYPGFEKEIFNEKNFYENLYPGKKYDKLKSKTLIHTLSSEMFKLCKEFLVQTGLNEDSHRREYYLLNGLREKRSYKEFEKIFKNSTANNELPEKGGVMDFINQFYSAQNSMVYNIENGDISGAVESIILQGECFAVAALIKGYRNPELSIAAKTHNVNFRENLIDNLMSHLDSGGVLEVMKKNNDKFYPYVAVNYAAYLMMKHTEDHKYYFEFKKMVDEYYSLFGQSERFYLYTMLISYCSLQCRNDNPGIFGREQFEIHKRSVELGVYKNSENDIMDIVKFRNIAICAFTFNETDWFETFVNDYINELKPEYRENMRYFSYAYVHFGRKEFGKSLENLIMVHDDFFYFKMDAKKLLLLIYFELGYFEQANSLTKSIKEYIANTKDLPDKIKDRERIFFKKVNELLNIKESGNKKDIGILETEILKDHNLPFKKWLMEKVNELKGDRSPRAS
ncbi:MAG TPA: hypothetical protein PKD83_05370 [Ignavibacteria bacterium]|nr:hypothetical protein [Ignavibacteria bacterium]